MIIVTGPQGTDEEVGQLAEAAGLLGGLPAYAATLQWAAATALYCLAGWEHCSIAVADVTIAQACGVEVLSLTA